MDSKAHLDYALFQLTPTRTRCDLVVFNGSKKEKLASGLVEPFISHLKYAKEQIPKGGYSITLRPPSLDSSWFTKGTLERFVRFVSTPEVLERFVTIEREITQIESSVQSNELSNNDAAGQTEEDVDNDANKSIVPYKPKDEGKGIDGAVQEETSKFRLQRVLETRIAVLRKEQAMAYFRAFVAGYEMDCIDDLIAFADAFGASRLRDACMNFKELCYKKHNDGLWMDELAAMEAYAQPELPYLGTSGITLTTESSNMSQSIMQTIQNGGLSHAQLERNGSGDVSVSESAASHPSSDVNQGQMPPTNSQSQYPISWPNQHPQFMYNYPNQQMLPYQGYPLPGMHPSHYQGNMQWLPNRGAYGDGVREPSDRRNRKSSSKQREKSHNGKESQTSEQDQHTESSDSTSEGELDAYSHHDQKHSSTEQLHKRRNGKKSSRMVVIRNINYITSKRKDGEKNDESGESSLDEDEFINGDALKQSVEDAVESLEKHKSTPRHHKKKGGNKTVTTTNGSSDANQDLEVSEGVQTNENWGAFQNLLLRADDSDPSEIETQRTLDVRDEYFTIQGSESGPPFAMSHAEELGSELGTKQRLVASDSFVVTERDRGNEGSTHLESFEEGGNLCVSMRKRDYMDGELLFSQRNDGAGAHIQDTFSVCTAETSLTKTQRGEDWFIINQPEKSVGADATKDSSIFDGDNAVMLGGDYFHAEKSNKNILVDDSFMIQDRSLADDQSHSQWRTDISMVSGLTVESQHESGIPDPSGDKCAMSASYEPDDLYMVLDRDSRVETAAAWATEVDYGMDTSFTESGKQQSGISVDDCIADEPASGTITDTKSNEDSEKKQPGKETRSKPLRGSLGKSKTEIISRNKRPSTISRVTMQKTKFETEEETRKRMEELLIERQKRIAERSAARGFASGTSKKAPVETKKGTTSLKDDKRTSRSAPQDTKKLSLQQPGSTSSTQNRLAPSTVPLKLIHTKKPSPKVNGEMATTLSPKTARDANKKSKLNQENSSKQLNGVPSPLSSVKDKDRANGSVSKLKIQARVPQVLPSDGTHTSENKELYGSPTNIAQKSSVDVDTLVDKSYDEGLIGIRESYLPVSENSAKLNSSPLENGKLYIASPVLQDETKVGHALQDNGVITEIKVDTAAEPKNVLNSNIVNLGAEKERIPASSEISEEEINPDWIESTPPSTIEHSLDQSHSRKKWTSDESTPTTKGFKKLLMFGRKKAQVAA